MLKDKIKKVIEEVLQEMDVKNIGEIELTYPPKVEMGDFSFGCFDLAKILGKSPMEIAEELVKLIKEKNKNGMFEKVEAVGPYVNFKFKNNILFGEVYKIISQLKDDNFKQDDKKSGEGQTEKVMVEYLSPNTNKPLHLGHLRNGVLGMATANLLEENNKKVIKAILINDRGIHICKSMLAWQLFGNGETPESSGIKGDHLVGKYYVKFSEEAKKNPELEEQAQEMLQKWEEGDKEVLKLWEMMNEWVIAGFEQTFKKFGFRFDKEYRESDTYQLGKNVVENGLKKGVFKKAKNSSIIFELPESFGLDKDGNTKKITVLRADGTSVYITQDLGTAVLRAQEEKIDQLIYVVASEQEYYFKSFFEILKALGYEWAKNNYHLSYEMVYLPEGRMKSREGKVVDADDLLSEVQELAKKGILERQGDNKKIAENDLETRSLKIALGAIKFYLLKVGTKQIIRFDAEKALSFEGFTGPYCQYAYARASKLWRDGKIELDNIDFSKLGTVEERQLIQKILDGEDKIRLASENFDPSILAKHIFELAKTFNQFYHSENILKAEEETKKARLALGEIFRKTVKRELALLGIDVLEEM